MSVVHTTGITVTCQTKMFVALFIFVQILQIVAGFFPHHHRHKFYQHRGHRQRKANFPGLPGFNWFTVKHDWNNFISPHTRFNYYESDQPECVFTKDNFHEGQGGFCRTENLIVRRDSSFWCIGFSGNKNEMVTVMLDRSFRFVSTPEVHYRQQGTGLTFFFHAGTMYSIKVSSGTEGMPGVLKVLVDDVDVCSKVEETKTIKNDVQSEEKIKPVPKKIEQHRISCGMRKVDHRPLIHGGVAASAGDWPWHVALYHLVGVNLIYKCGGALISNGFVLTCAHCLTRQGQILGTERIRVYLGKTSLSRFDENSKESKVDTIIIHPEYDIVIAKHDIALLKLSTPVTFTPYIQPICLPSHEFHIENSTGTVIGWGKTEKGQLSDDLRHARMTVMTKMECLESNRDFYGQLLYDGNFCAGLTAVTPCTGDSGGGMYFRVGVNWILGGLVSTGVETDKGTCDHRYFVLFTDVQKHTKWIMENVQ